MDCLFRLSESRGKEAAGIAVLTDDRIQVYKEAISASEMIRRPEYSRLLESVRGGNGSGRLNHPLAVIGHSRLVTNGGQDDRLNNQPVMNAGGVGIHNGIVVNDEEIWKAFPHLPRNGRVDSEVIVGLIRHFHAAGGSLTQAVRQAFRIIRGAASVAVIFEDLDYLLLATNNGSLYTLGDAAKGLRVFASERYILQQLLGRRGLLPFEGDTQISHIRPGQALLVGLNDLAETGFSLNDEEPVQDHAKRISAPRKILEVESIRPPGYLHPRSSVAVPGAFAPDHPAPQDGSDRDAIAALRRCRRCILPETMPFITFDEEGVCNYCRHWQPVKVHGREALERILAPYRARDGRADCLVGLSGGRDSSYGLHYLKTELKLNPIAFTYDWGMVTDLARRNISRLCGTLGVEHILVSANIARKRLHIKRNVEAWLKKPHLGMIPLFMAGDKQYFYQAKKLRRQTGVELVLLCENMLERTHFKSGFAGVPPFMEDENHVYTLPVLSKLKMISFYGWQYLSNPAYLNISIPDTLFAYACYYLFTRDYHNLYRFIEWDEQTIENTLRNEYDWEVSPDTPSTWRIGDGTASFYNYIYFTVAGFSEHDTFRSNQIRQGVITRERALELVAQENRPRWESIKWYCDIIDVDFDAAIRRINAMPKLYHERRGR
ncbi:MAG TPA: hypothetical protein PLV57_22215 [Phycisphaerae bacterium]|nr:hypothetical protein [Phycisphaerae bacterium]HPP29229.1 hypothetical protein [Phycisphaerae bacterium]